jgi:hypothetical protein
MFKKLALIFSALFFLVFFCVFLLFLNINKVLNSSGFKKRLYSYLKTHRHIELKYEKIKVKLPQGKCTLKNLYFKSSRYELHLPEGKLYFSFSKLLAFKYTPVKVITSDITLKIYRSDKKFNPEKLVSNLQNLSPFYLALKNGTIDYETPLGWIKLKKTELNLRIDKKQALYELDAVSSAFKNVHLTGRFSYNKGIFSESMVKLKELDLSKLKWFARRGILKSAIDLNSQIILEKNTLNIAFTSLNPWIIIKKLPQERLQGTYIEGIVLIKGGEIQTTFNPVILKYPKVKGFLKVTKDKKNYKVDLRIEKLDVASIRKIALKVFSKNKGIGKLFEIVRGGNLYNLKIENSGKSLKDLFHIKNLGLKADVRGGYIELSFLPFKIGGIKGELYFKKKVLNFKGSTLINRDIPCNVENLTLNFSRKKIYLDLRGNFTGEAEELKNILIHLSKKHKLEWLNNYKFKGIVKGEIELKGKTSEITGKVKVYLNNFFAQTPYYKYSFFVKKGKITYDFTQLKAELSKVSTKSLAFKHLVFNIKLKTFDFDLFATDITGEKGALSALKIKLSKIKKIISHYKVDWQKIKIKELSFVSNWHLFIKNPAEEIKKKLFCEGKAERIKAEIPYKKEIFNLKSPKIVFKFDKGVFVLKDSSVDVEDSSFKISGTFKEKELIVKGRGEIRNKLAKKIEKLIKLPSQLAFRTPIKVEKFAVNYIQGKLFHIGSYRISENKITLFIQKDKEGFINLEISLVNSFSNFKVNFKESKGKYFIKSAGILNLREFVTLFKRKDPELKGEIESSLTLVLPSEKLPLNFKNLKKLSYFYLKNPIFLEDSYLRCKKVSFLYNGNKTLFINFSGNFTKKSLKISELEFKWKDSFIKGSFKVNKKPDYIYITGNFTGDKINLKELRKKSKSKSKALKKIKRNDIFFFDEIPLQADAHIKINTLILPTSHSLRNLTGKISLDSRKKTFTLNIPQLDFCNIKMQVLYKKELKKQYLFVDISPSQGDFLDLFSCLYPEEMPKIILEGPYKIKGYFYAEGTQKNLFKKTTGEIKIESKNGYIYKAPLLAKLFAFLSPIDLFRGKIPNLETDVLSYEELKIEGTIKNSSFLINNAFLSAPGFRLFGMGLVNFSNKKIDLTFYVSPFKTADVIIENIPLLGKWILSKPRMLVYIPLKVEGTYKHYKIIPLHPSSIGKGAFDFIFRLFGVPEKFYKHPEKKSKIRKKMLEKKNEILHPTP